MKRNDIFTFIAPNGVEVTGIVVDIIKDDRDYQWYLCYAQNRIFHYQEIAGLAKPIVTVGVVYAILPDYDAILESQQHEINMDERIDSYLRGQMIKEEESQFISDCENNSELKERAYITALLAKSLKNK